MHGSKLGKLLVELLLASSRSSLATRIRSSLNLKVGLSLILNLRLILGLDLGLNPGLFLPRLLPPRQSLVHPLPGRIVVRERCTTTYRWQPSPWNAAARLPLFREGVRRWQALQPVTRGAHRSHEREELRSRAPAPELRPSLRHSVTHSTADSTRGSRPDSSRY